MHNNVFNFFSCISVVFPPKKIFYSDFGPSALRLRMEESAVIFAAYDVWYGEDMRGRPIKKHPLVSSTSHNGVLLCSTCVYLVSLDYETSLPHPSPYHTSQQAADLVFKPTMKRSQKREKSNFERNFLAKNSKREKITKLTSLMLEFAKKNIGKIADFGFQFPFKIIE